MRRGRRRRGPGWCAHCAREQPLRVLQCCGYSQAEEKDSLGGKLSLASFAIHYRAGACLCAYLAPELQAVHWSRLAREYRPTLVLPQTTLISHTSGTSLYRPTFVPVHFSLLLLFPLRDFLFSFSVFCLAAGVSDIQVLVSRQCWDFQRT